MPPCPGELWGLGMCRQSFVSCGQSSYCGKICASCVLLLSTACQTSRRSSEVPPGVLWECRLGGRRPTCSACKGEARKWMCAACDNTTRFAPGMLWECFGSALGALWESYGSTPGAGVFILVFQDSWRSATKVSLLVHNRRLRTRPAPRMCSGKIVALGQGDVHLAWI